MAQHNFLELTTTACDKDQYLLSVFDDLKFSFFLYLCEEICLHIQASKHWDLKLIMSEAEKPLKRNSKQTKQSCKLLFAYTPGRETDRERGRVLMKGDVRKQWKSAEMKTTNLQSNLFLFSTPNNSWKCGRLVPRDLGPESSTLLAFSAG